MPNCSKCGVEVTQWWTWFREDCPNGDGHTLTLEERDSLSQETPSEEEDDE